MDTFHSCCRSVYFYPRPPRGGRLELHYFFTHHRKFLSTPSARRATGDAESQSGMDENFYPRPPRGGRPPQLCLFVKRFFISIHALREEGDRNSNHEAGRRNGFLSTPSARRATTVYVSL